MAFSQLSSGQFETQLGYVKPRLSIIASDAIASLNFAGITKDFGVSLFLGGEYHQTAKGSNLVSAK